MSILNGNCLSNRTLLMLYALICCNCRFSQEDGGCSQDCDALKPWVRSAVNHMYWSAVSTPPCDDAARGLMVAAKWQSLLNHILNVHTGHGHLFPDCQHEPLHGREARKPWIKPSLGHIDTVNMCCDTLRGIWDP